MKLTDKRFLKFEAMMLLCGVILLCQMLVVLLCDGAEFESCNGAVLILQFPVLCLYFAVSGIPAWLLYKGNSWPIRTEGRQRRTAPRAAVSARRRVDIRKHQQLRTVLYGTDRATED